MVEAIGTDRLMRLRRERGHSCTSRAAGRSHRRLMSRRPTLHQAHRPPRIIMSVNGNRDDSTRADLDACASSAMMKRGRARTIVDEVVVAVNRWPEFADAAQVADRSHARIGQSHRLAW